MEVPHEDATLPVKPMQQQDIGVHIHADVKQTRDTDAALHADMQPLGCSCSCSNSPPLITNTHTC